MDRAFLRLFLALLLAALAASCAKNIETDPLNPVYQGEVTPITEPVDLVYAPDQGTWTEESVIIYGKGRMESGSVTNWKSTLEGDNLAWKLLVPKIWDNEGTTSHDPSLVELLILSDKKGNILEFDAQSPYLEAQGIVFQNSDAYTEFEYIFSSIIFAINPNPVKSGDLLFQRNISEILASKYTFDDETIIDYTLEGYVRYNGRKCVLTSIDHGKINTMLKENNEKAIIEFMRGYIIFDADTMVMVKCLLNYNIRFPENGLRLKCYSIVGLD